MIPVNAKVSKNIFGFGVLWSLSVVNHKSGVALDRNARTHKYEDIHLGSNNRSLRRCGKNMQCTFHLRIPIIRVVVRGIFMCSCYIEPWPQTHQLKRSRCFLSGSTSAFTFRYFILEPLHTTLRNRRNSPQDKYFFQIHNPKPSVRARPHHHSPEAWA